MYKIKIKNPSVALFLVSIGSLILYGTTFIPVFNVRVEIPLLLAGGAVAFSVFNLFKYTKATARQILVLSLANTFIFSLLVLLTMLGHRSSSNELAKLAAGFELNPFFLFISIYISAYALHSLVFFEEVRQCRAQKRVPSRATHSYTESQPVISESGPVYENNILTQNIMEKPEIILTEENLLNIESVIPQEVKTKNEDPDTEYILDLDTPKTTIQSQEKPIFSEELFIKPETETLTFKLPDEKPSMPDISENLGDLPDISLDTSNSAQKTDNDHSSQIKYDNSIFEDDYANYIPDSVRLVENAVSKKNNESGQISAIGKLLVNFKDIENIIEINEAINQVENDADGSNIITKILGEKLKETLDKIESEFPDLRKSTISNKAGFTIASLINNSKIEQTIGALSSGAFQALQNYLTRINFENSTKIFFETENFVHILVKADNFIFFFECEREFQPINYTLLRDVISQKVFSNPDLSVIKNIKGIIESVITDKEGHLIGSINCEEPVKLASITSAIFENLKVFISNIQPSQLEKIVIFSNDKVLTIKKYNDAIASLVSSQEGPVVLSDKIIKLEGLIR